MYPKFALILIILCTLKFTVVYTLYSIAHRIVEAVLWMLLYCLHCNMKCTVMYILFSEFYCLFLGVLWSLPHCKQLTECLIVHTAPGPYLLVLYTIYLASFKPYFSCSQFPLIALLIPGLVSCYLVNWLLGPRFSFTTCLYADARNNLVKRILLRKPLCESRFYV